MLHARHSVHLRRQFPINPVHLHVERLEQNLLINNWAQCAEWASRPTRAGTTSGAARSTAARRSSGPCRTPSTTSTCPAIRHDVDSSWRFPRLT
jgi:hypothetical protein